MSQAKVDRYKEAKKNRSKEMKKEKRERFVVKAVGIVVVVALVAWIGFSVYQTIKPNLVNTYQVKTQALDEYLTDLQASEVAETEAVEEAVETETTATETAE